MSNSHASSDASQSADSSENGTSPASEDPMIVGASSSAARDDASSTRPRPTGEHGRVSRCHTTAEDWAYEEDGNKEEDDDDDGEGCESFWNGVCEDVDCISNQKRHCRYQCALAEVDEEVKKKEWCVSKRGMKLRWSRK